MSSLVIEASFTIDNAAHWASVRTQTTSATIKLDASGGVYDGQRWTGDFMKVTGSGSPNRVQIENWDARRIRDLRLTVRFTINGAEHEDAEPIGDFTGNINLTLNGNGGNFDGTRWTGDFLRK